MRNSALIVLPLVVLLLVAPAGVLAQGPVADPAFEVIWQRTDAPVRNGIVARTYYWGPCTSTPGGIREPLQGAPGNSRVVQYFDKSRMEINDPTGDRSQPWFVTNGLLARELITGQMQVGYNAFEQRTPSSSSVTGDPGDTRAPSYRALGRVLSLPPRAEGITITETIDRDGAVGNNVTLGNYGVTSGDLLLETNHRLASVFREFLLTRGPVIENGQLIVAPVADPTFFVTGLPTSEAYWTRAAIAGVVRDVLVQVFERRILTYVPTNPEGFQVEMGNIGLHYRAWRYGTSLNYFAALVGSRWTYRNSGTGLNTTYRVVGLNSTFKPGQTLLAVQITNAADPQHPTTEFWEQRDDALLYHGLRLDSGETVKYDPPYTLYRYCMEVGQSWSVQTTKSESPSGQRQAVTYTFKVEAAESITTPAGAFPTFRIKATDNDTVNGSIKEATYWFNPYTGMVKRQILEFSLDLASATLAP